MEFEGTSRSWIWRSLLAGALLGLFAAAPGWAEPLPPLQSLPPLRVGGQLRLPAGVRPEAVSIELVPMFEELAVAVKRLSGAPGPAPLAVTRPRPDGFYELTAPEAGFYRVAFRAAGCPRFQLSLSPLVEEGELQPFELPCSPPTGPRAAEPTGGRPALGKAFLAVETARGEPVAGALVRSSREAFPLGVTGPDGRLAFTPASLVQPGWRTLTLQVETPDGGRATVSPPPGLAAGVVLPVVPRPPVAVAGRVVRAEGGQPVAGALVWNGEGPTSAPARTDAEGRFQLLAAADEPLQLSAAAPGFLPLERQSLPSPTRPALLQLRPAAHLAGVVVDPRGGPVAGASLSIALGRTTWSRPDGRFRLSGLLPRGTYELTVRKTGFPEATAAGRTAAAGREPPPLRIVLGEGRRAVGRVVDDAGRPVARVELTLRAEHRDEFFWEDDEEPAAGATSDARGAFELRHLPPGRFELHAARRGFAPARRPGIEIGAGTAPVDLGEVTLAPGLAIEGVVTDRGGSPVAGAKVGLEPPAVASGAELKIADDPALSRLTRTEADGSFRLADLPRGAPFNLRVDHPDYVPVRLVRVTAPTPEPLRIELKTGRSVTGRVVGPRGEPVPGARVAQVEQEGAGSRVTGLEETDAKGVFRLTRVAAGTLRLEVSANGYRRRRTDGIPILEDRDVEGIEVTLDPGASLSGRVLDSRGEPVAGARVSAFGEERPPGGPFFGFLHPVRTDGAGRWSIGGLAPGRARVQADSSRGQVEARLQLEAGENHLDLTLPARAEVSGRVSDEEGAPLPGAGVLLTPIGGGQSHGALSEADGTFVLPGMPDGDYALRASKSGFAEATYPGGVRIAGQPVGGLDLRLTRRRPSAIAGRLLGLGPEELVGAQVVALCNGGQRLPGAVGRDGRYRIADASPGDCQVEATSASGNSAEASVRVEPDAAEAVLDLEFQSGFTLSGHVLVDGRPLAGATVLVQAATGNFPRPAEVLGLTAYDGSFSLAHVKPGPHVLQVLSPDGVEKRQTVDVTADRAFEIRLSAGKGRGGARAEGTPPE
ncbi:MAG TPA: carboxypeptidase-like regulatory domain-containing protein [Thermoanaerobaculia bacterium]|nr:carboxypeptidase-like regulatory domain-containing protein [Thermoanaerobaculia bacterium]